ncbi:MAG TPA: CARDB domain-containing protein [Xanthomonadales bacterium]|nr:CARDB domain-containing protein [Xanthomonadales bacterium]
MTQRKAILLQVLLALASFVWMSPVAHAEILPDLVIEQARIEPSNPSLMRVKVANVGFLAATSTQLSLLIERQDETISTTVTTPLLKAGDRQWMVIALGMRPVPTDRVVLRIDEPGWLDESDESNNEFLYPEP